MPLPQLTVGISPPEAIAAGAAWRLAGKTDWRPSGVAQTNTSAGVHGVEFRPIPDWIVPRTDPVVMPRTNAGWRVQPRALPDSDYRFMGWHGDVSGSRNPVTLVMNRAYAVQARFARVLGSGGAVQMARGYFSPGTLVVYSQFNYDRGQPLRELRWRPSLPPGPNLAAVAGLTGPEISDGQIVFTGQLGHNPVPLNLTIEVPAGEVAPRELGGVVEYSFVGGAESVVRLVDTPFGTGSLGLNPRPSPAAHLAIRRAEGHPVLRLTGEVGRT